MRESNAHLVADNDEDEADRFASQSLSALSPRLRPALSPALRQPPSHRRPACTASSHGDRGDDGDRSTGRRRSRGTPCAGAVRYELQISQSPTFQDNGILYDGKSFLTPVAAPSLTLPWITGNPHSLYARVRAIRVRGVTSPWSADYGFDVVPPAPPASISSYDGLLRWSPVQGATGYQVWLLDAAKIETVNTNVLDEREFYDSSFSGNLLWRVRALRLTCRRPAQRDADHDARRLEPDLYGDHDRAGQRSDQPRWHGFGVLLQRQHGVERPQVDARLRLDGKPGPLSGVTASSSASRCSPTAAV